MENPTVLVNSVVREEFDANCAKPLNDPQPAPETERLLVVNLRLSLSVTHPPGTITGGIRPPLPDEGIMIKLAVI